MNDKLYYESLRIYPNPPPDLRVLSENISFSPDPAYYGNSVTISAEILNEGVQTAMDFSVRFTIESELGVEQVGSSAAVASLAPAASVIVQTSMTSLECCNYLCQTKPPITVLGGELTS